VQKSIITLEQNTVQMIILGQYLTTLPVKCNRVQHGRERVLKPFLKDLKLLRPLYYLAVPRNVEALSPTHRSAYQDHHMVS
jgi:hypothetical protein